MRRREFITLLGGAAFAWPLAARAQQPDGSRRIGVLMGFPESDSQAQRYIAAFRDGLHKLGWTEGRNVRIDTRWATPAERELDAAIRERTRRATARPHSFAHHTHHDRAAATNAHHPDRFRDGYRSGWQRLCRELPAAGRQRHRFHRMEPKIAASGWSCSRRLHRASTGSHACSIRQRRHIANFT